jgi:hypothetical protein
MDATPVESYDQLVTILRNRIVELGIIYDAVDSIAGCRRINIKNDKPACSDSKAASAPRA